jgi:hypothetical protein
MTRPIIRIHNAETNEIVDREMNEAEFAKYEANQAALLQRQAQAEAELSQRQAILDRLGLTSEEARLILG